MRQGTDLGSVIKQRQKEKGKGKNYNRIIKPGHMKQNKSTTEPWRQPKTVTDPLDALQANHFL